MDHWRIDRELLRSWLAEGRSLPEIGRLVGRHPSTVGYWVRKHGLEASGQSRHCARGPLGRDVLEAMVDRGLTQREMAAEVGRSVATVRHWLARHGLQREARNTRAGREETARAGRPIVVRSCAHGLTDFGLEGRGYYRCLECRKERVSARRRKLKAILVVEAGGKCEICGYDTYAGALQFHHRDPARKCFALGLSGMTRSIDVLRQEATKCVLLCANCHAEVEAEIASLT